ncbi:MAG: PIN domain-containing protein [Nitrospirae bacterium]|nr:PIN domain-containing protein [Nitrospirota bacterium]
METLTYLDTHVVVWVYAGLLDRLSDAVMERIECDRIVISPMVELELQYLFETGRVGIPGKIVVSELGERIGLGVCSKPFLKIIACALQQNWTRDPFDRIIVAHAALDDSVLVSRDRAIADNYSRTFWQ